MRRAILIAAVLGVLLSGGCGIPDNSDVREIGAGPSAGPAQGDDIVPPAPVDRQQTTDVATFVSYYLQAAAGDLDSATQRVTAFMTPEAKKAFKPRGTGLEVVRPTEEPLINPGESDVTLHVQEVGTLGDDGVLVPSSSPQVQTLSFRIEMRQGGLYLTNAPQALLLSDKGLEKYYQQHTIYFWNTDNTGLVPDVRWMPLSVPTVQQPTTILNWLASGPADWLTSAAHGFPHSTTVPDFIPAISNDRLQISLSGQAVSPGDNVGLDRLRRQLLWSLRPLTPSALELTIGHQNPVTYTDSDYLDSNAAYGLRDQPDRFVVYNGTIRRLSSESAHSVDVVPVLKPAANRGIQKAALSDSAQHTFAAVVTGSGATSALRVAVATTGQQADLRTVRGLDGSLGYPAWAITAAGDTDTAVGLITSGRRLYSFSADARAAAQPVEWQEGGDRGPITAFSVAPDGHRIALVAGGNLYRGVLTVGAGGVALSAADQLLPPGLGSLSAVAWTSEGSLVVAGVKTTTKRVALVNMSIDAAEATDRLPDIGTDTVSYLTAYPINPVTRTQVNDAEVAYVARGDAWSAPGYASRITTSELAGPASSPSGGPASLTAPFFLN